MITNVSELYVCVRRIIKALDEGQQFGLAKRLEDAMQISTVPGEILGEVRLALNDINVSDEEIPESVRAEAAGGITFIERLYPGLSELSGEAWVD